jgi:hypothetical protein
MNDYPKFGVWPDGYYATFNQFSMHKDGSSAWGGGGAIAYESSRMLAHLPARQVYFNLFPVDPNLGGMLPSDLDGANLPPVGAPNVFAQVDASEWGYRQDQLELWNFHVDWAHPANSTFIRASGSPLRTAWFTPWICGRGRSDCVQQQGTPTLLDALNDRAMFRLQYRNFNGATVGTGGSAMTLNQTLVFTHTIGASQPGTAAVRVYRIDATSLAAKPTWTLPTQNQWTVDPGDERSRWLGSAALDQAGNLAVGYSESSSGMRPSMSYSGRTVDDPAGELRTEPTPISHPGSEDGKYGRWGDYSDLTVDPSDDCTFYYTNEYYATTGQYGWATRIMAFRFPNCP